MVYCHMARGLPMTLTFLNGWKNNKRLIGGDARELHEIQISLSVSEVLPEHSHTRWSTHCLWLPLHGDGGQWRRPRNPGHLLSGPRQKQPANLRLRAAFYRDQEPGSANRPSLQQVSNRSPGMSLPRGALPWQSAGRDAGSWPKHIPKCQNKNDLTWDRWWPSGGVAETVWMLTQIPGPDNGLGTTEQNVGK